MLAASWYSTEIHNQVHLPSSQGFLGLQEDWGLGRKPQTDRLKLLEYYIIIIIIWNNDTFSIR